MYYIERLNYCNFTNIFKNFTNFLEILQIFEKFQEKNCLGGHKMTVTDKMRERAKYQT